MKDRNIKQVLHKADTNGRVNRVKEEDYDQCTLYTSMKIEQ
jgi:hypothetical protein